MKKKYYSWTDVEVMCQSIVNQMYKDNWTPDYIVGITRGGNTPATIISNIIDVPCEAVKISLRDGSGGESNLWMSEEAFGYVPETDRAEGPFNSGTVYSDPSLRKQILIVDDINDTGSTFEWLVDDWKSSCLPDDESWDDIFGHSVRFAVLTENLSSEFDKVNYFGTEINKAEDDVWICYPWETVGTFNG